MSQQEKGKVLPFKQKNEGSESPGDYSESDVQKNFYQWKEGMESLESRPSVDEFNEKRFLEEYIKVSKQIEERKYYSMGARTVEQGFEDLERELLRLRKSVPENYEHMLSLEAAEKRKVEIDREVEL